MKSLEPVLSSVLYPIADLRCSFASLSIHFNLQCTDPSEAEILRYISNQKRHNTQWPEHYGPAPSHTQSLVPGSPLISMNIVRSLSSDCARHKCLDFLSARRHSEECCFSRVWEDLTISKSTNWGEK